MGDTRIRLPSSHVVHIRQEIGGPDFQVWLNTEAMDFDGLCVGSGWSREQAIDDALETFEQCLAVLLKEKRKQEGATDEGVPDVRV